MFVASWKTTVADHPTIADRQGVRAGRAQGYIGELGELWWGKRWGRSRTIWKEGGRGRWLSATRVWGEGSLRRSMPSFRCRYDPYGKKEKLLLNTFFLQQLLLTFGCVVAFNQSYEIKWVYIDRKLEVCFSSLCKGAFSCKDTSQRQCTGLLLEFRPSAAWSSSLPWPASGASECKFKIQNIASEPQWYIINFLVFFAELSRSTSSCWLSSLQPSQC